MSCSFSSTPIDVHGFSNLVVNNDNVWFGAGYKLYQVNLSQQTARVVVDTKDIAISFVQIDDNNLYFGGINSPKGEGSAIWLLNLNDESIEWKKEIKYDWMGGGYIVTPPLTGKDTLIIGTRTGLYGYDKVNGDVKWHLSSNWFGGDELLTPILASEKLFYGIDEISGNTSANHTIAIADSSSGKTIQTISMPGSLGAIPAIHGDCLFVKDYQYYKTDTSGKLQWIGELRLNCVDINTGEIIWTYNGNGVPASSKPSFYDGLVFDVFANQLYAIDEKSGILKWQSPELEAAAKNPQVVKDVGVIALEIPSSNKVVFLDLKTGNLLDNELLDSLSSPVFIGQDVIYGTTNALVRVNIATGKVIWSIPVVSKYQVFQDD